MKSISAKVTGLKPFRFYNMWCEHPSYKEVVNAVWSLDFNGPSMAILVAKLNCLRKKRN